MNNIYTAEATMINIAVNIAKQYCAIFYCQRLPAGLQWLARLAMRPLF